MTLPRSFSHIPRWFSSSVHTFDTKDKYSRRLISSKADISSVYFSLNRKWLFFAFCILRSNDVCQCCCPLPANRQTAVITVRTVNRFTQVLGGIFEVFVLYLSVSIPYYLHLYFCTLCTFYTTTLFPLLLCKFRVLHQNIYFISKTYLKYHGKMFPVSVLLLYKMLLD